MGQILLSWRESKGTARPAEANAIRAKASAAILILILLLGGNDLYWGERVCYCKQGFPIACSSSKILYL